MKITKDNCNMDIEPCQHCGRCVESGDLHVYWYDDAHDQAGCCNCGARGPLAYDTPSAIRAWNVTNGTHVAVL